MPNRYALHPQPFLAPVVVAALIIAPVGYLIPWLSDVRAGEPALPGLLLGLGVYAAVVGAIVLVRYLTWSREGQVIELGEAHVELPLSAGSRRTRSVAYEDLLSVGTIGVGPRARLLIGARTRTFLYAAKHFVEGPAAIAALCAELRQRIALRPGGSDQLAVMDEREMLGARLIRMPPRFSIGILIVLAGFYIWTAAAGAFEPEFRLVRFGANVPSLVADGEWYRLFSGNFLHAGLIHIYFNGLGIFVLGGLLERLLGSWRFVCVYLVSALGGALASAWAAIALLSVGASTAVFGLLGSLAFLNWRFRAVLPGGFRQPLRWWVFILGINALLPVIAPMIDYWAHIGGFAAGAFATSVLCSNERTLQPPHTVGQATKIATSALVILCVLSLGEAITNESTARGSEGELAVARQFIGQDSIGPLELNVFAWEYATTPDLTDDELEVAEMAAERAVERMQHPAILDTLATVYYRRRDYDAAVRTQARALSLAEERELVSQMGRFLDARRARSGVFYRDGGQGAVTRVALEGDVVVIDVARVGDRGVEIYALDDPEGELRGTLRLSIGQGVAVGTHEVRIPAPGSAAMPSNAELAIAYVDAGDCRCEPGSIRARYFPMDPEIRRLP